MTTSLKKQQEGLELLHLESARLSTTIILRLPLFNYQTLTSVLCLTAAVVICVSTLREASNVNALTLNWACHLTTRPVMVSIKDEIWKKKTVLWGTITWFVMGRQNIQAKNVYWSNKKVLNDSLGALSLFSWMRNTCEGKTTTTNQWGSAGSLVDLEQ